MTPKEKAEELLNKYKDLTKDYPVDLDYDGEYIYLPKTFSKRAALMAVDEIMSANKHTNHPASESESTTAWWLGVKEEIKKF